MLKKGNDGLEKYSKDVIEETPFSKLNLAFTRKLLILSKFLRNLLMGELYNQAFYLKLSKLYGIIRFMISFIFRVVFTVNHTCTCPSWPIADKNI